MMNVIRRNLLLVSMFFAVTAFTAYREGYLSMLSASFLVILGLGGVMIIWLALTASTARVASLMLSVYMIEFFKESIGIDSGFWVYHGIQGHYNFGVWGWVVGGLSVYTISSKASAWFAGRGWLAAPTWLNTVMVLCLAVFAVSMLGPYRQGAGTEFYVFYAILIAACLYASTKMEFRTLAAITLTAWVVGYMSEYAGSVDSGVWTYPHDPDGPPLYLIIGCWPLEITAQVAVSAFLAGEHIDR